jgi:hypothetical protein
MAEFESTSNHHPHRVARKYDIIIPQLRFNVIFVAPPLLSIVIAIFFFQ